MRNLYKKFVTIVIGALVCTSSTTSVGVAVEKTKATNQKKQFFHLVKSPKVQIDSKHDDGIGERRVTPWVSVAVLLNFLFFFRSFAAPFFDPLGEPRTATSSTIYFTFLAFIYVWLASVTTLTVVPHISTKYNVIIATALFFYMSFMSIGTLLFGRFAIRCTYYAWLFVLNGDHKKIDWSKTTTQQSTSEPDLTGIAPPLRRSQSAILTRAALQKTQTFPTLVAFHRPFRRVFRSSLMISASLCLIYAHCWSRSLSAFKASQEASGTVVCRGIFGPLIWLFPSFTNAGKSCNNNRSCANESLIWLLWAGPILSHLFYFTMNEFSGKHLEGYKQPRKSLTTRMSQELEGSGSLEKDGINDLYDDANGDGANDDDLNIEWSLSSTIHKFARSKLERPKNALAMVPWFHVMLIKSGFDLLVSLHIFLGRFDARKMQVALRKSNNNSTGDQDGVFDFTRGENGANQQHPDSSASGFWFDFMSDCGDGFNSSYQVARCLAQPSLAVTTQSASSKRRVKRILPRGKVLVIGGDLAYPDPTPETYEDRFFRTFEDALPPPKEFRKEHISIHKPALPVKSWAVPSVRERVMEEEKKCSDGHNTKGEPKDASLSSYPGPVAFAIPGNHDWFDGLATYTRYILSRDWLGGWILPQQASYFALELPKGWWVLGMDLALDNDINIEQFGFFADLAKKSMKADDNVIIVTHIPFWTLVNYEHYPDQPEKNLLELLKTHLKGRVRLRLAGDLHHYTRHMPSSINLKTESDDEPVLIVSGGGGAFLHPTHCFQEVIQFGKQEYVRVSAYPSTNVSKHLSWMNLWQFRWRNWRLDIFWLVTYFGVCSSFFPLCGVYDDYLKSNPTHSFSGLARWALSRVLILIKGIFISGRVSLFFTIVVLIFIMGFTETGKSRVSTRYAWSMMHALMHISTALLCLLFVECMAEFIISEGLVQTQNEDTASQSCETGLASSIFDEYENHFMHALDDFHILGKSNSTFLSGCRDMFQSSRLDERIYDFVSETFSWLYNEAPYMQRTLEFFDLPGVIGSAHAKMCSHLCKDGMECLYSNNFAAFQQLDRLLIIKYLSAISFYFGIFAVPIAGNVLGTWLALTLNVLKSQYNEGFSSLRLEHWKNFLRMHIDEQGDLEIFSIGLHRVPKKWMKDPLWDGDIYKGGTLPTKPSFLWKSPSKWMPMRHSKKCTPEIIDYTKIHRQKRCAR